MSINKEKPSEWDEISDDEVKILECLHEAAMAGIFRFVADCKMRKVVEIEHKFKNENFSQSNHIESVRITIEPISMDEENILRRFSSKVLN